MNIPNFFSMLRIVSIPLFIICLTYEQNIGALAVLIFAAITDALDGFFARWFHQKTSLGAYLDPIADKMLLTSSFVACSLLHLIPRWLTILVVSRDVIISIGILLLKLTSFQIEIRPSMLSKCTTCLQLFTIAMVLILEIMGKSNIIALIVFWLTGALTVVSGLHYIYLGLKLVNKGSSG